MVPQYLVHFLQSAKSVKRRRISSKSSWLPLLASLPSLCSSLINFITWRGRLAIRNITVSLAILPQAWRHLLLTEHHKHKFAEDLAGDNQQEKLQVGMVAKQVIARQIQQHVCVYIFNTSFKKVRSLILIIKWLCSITMQCACRAPIHLSLKVQTIRTSSFHNKVRRNNKQILGTFYIAKTNTLKMLGGKYPPFYPPIFGKIGIPIKNRYTESTGRPDYHWTFILAL